jgi:hypothetical protein
VCCCRHCSNHQCQGCDYHLQVLHKAICLIGFYKFFFFTLQI